MGRERERGARVEVLKDVKGEMSRGERSTRVDARRIEGRRMEREGPVYRVLPSYYPYLRV